MSEMHVSLGYQAVRMILVDIAGEDPKLGPRKTYRRTGQTFYMVAVLADSYKWLM